MPIRDGEAWNDEDLQRLRRLARDGEPLAAIARALDRTPSAVRARARRLKIVVAGDLGSARRRPVPADTVAGWRYRVTVFGKPRAPWRDARPHAVQDAIDLGLASWDDERRQWFIAVPTDIEVDTQTEGS